MHKLNPAHALGAARYFKEGFPEDRTRVDLSDDREVEYWTYKLHVTTEKLTRAVHVVGTSVRAIKVYLAMH